MLPATVRLHTTGTKEKEFSAWPRHVGLKQFLWGAPIGYGNIVNVPRTSSHSGSWFKKKMPLVSSAKLPRIFPAKSKLFNSGREWMRLAMAAAALSPSWLLPGLHQLAMFQLDLCVPTLQHGLMMHLSCQIGPWDISPSNWNSLVSAIISLKPIKSIQITHATRTVKLPKINVKHWKGLHFRGPCDSSDCSGYHWRTPKTKIISVQETEINLGHASAFQLPEQIPGPICHCSGTCFSLKTYGKREREREWV